MEKLAEILGDSFQMLSQPDKWCKRMTAISLVTCLAGCASLTHNRNTMENSKTDKSASKADTTPKVTGIGGIFFYSDDPKQTKEWYTKNLGIEINAWGSAGFDSRNVDKPEEINSLQWKPFETGDAYFSPSKKDFMINYQVQNLEGMVSKLNENGVTVLDSIATYDYGKFVHIMDADGNKIELWEPVDNK
jgi:predicted enzyme related to lactoylglutathione lyase